MKKGVLSKVRCAITRNELCLQQTLLRESEISENIQTYGVAPLCNFQSQMMAWIDCSTNWKKENLDSHNVYPDFAAKAKLDWSKNVEEEADCPWQILFGAMDPLFCVFIGLAIWLEFYLMGYDQ